MSYVIEPEQHLGGSLNTTNPWGDPGTWGPEIWNKIIKDYNIKSVLDIGCGKGYSTKYFADKGLISVGIEGGVNTVYNSIYNNIIRHDYTKGTTNVGEYDLIWCCEFVEHVEEKYLNNFLTDFKKGKYIAITYADKDQPGHHHVNCQNSEYWIKLIEKEGYNYKDDYSKELRNIAEKWNNSSSFPHSGHLTRLLFFEKI